MLKIRYLIIALLCAVAQGAWAQTGVASETDLKDAITNGASITLTADITLSDYVNISDGKTVTIDLNGHTLNRGLSKLTSYGNVIRVENGGTLTVKDSSTGGTITGGYDATGGGICVLGTLNFQGGTISGCNGTRGGAIYTTSDGTVNMTGGSITDNRADSYGGGIYVSSGSTISMSGNPKITDNENGNLYLDDTSVINVTGAFTSGEGGASIGVSLENGKYNRAFTSGYSTYNNADPSTFFRADLSGATLSVLVSTGSSEAKLSASGQIYVECSWTGGDTDGHVVKTTRLASNWSNYSDTESLEGGWYVFSGSDTYNKRPAIHGDVKFILQDGCNVEFKKGIHVNQNNTLTIYAQAGGTGKLRATGDDGSSLQGDAAIGGNNGVKGGTLVIHGGDIYAYPTHDDAAGIGGGDDSDSGMESLTIWGGTIEARGRSGGAGIGGGQKNNITTTTIYGGTVKAKSDKYGAGIGGGEYGGNGTIKIYGGTVTATGGKEATGIGPGDDADGNNPIYIYGGTVTAKGGESAAGIGSCEAKKFENYIYIYGGNVTATGGKYGAGIGTGKRGRLTYFHALQFHGGTVTATGGEGAAGIGGGYDGNLISKIYVKGGTIYATGGKNAAGFGTGEEASSLNAEISGGYLEAKSPGGDAACIGNGKGSNKSSNISITGGTVKCIYTNEYSGEYKNNMYIGRGGTDNTSPSDETVSIPSTYKVTKDGSTVASGSRVSTCKSSPSGYSTLIIEACDHEGANYTVKDENKHTFSCSYCAGSEENHDTDGANGSCSKCGYGSGTYTITLYESNENGTGYDSTPIIYTTGYGVTFNLPECGTVPDKKDFVGWKLVTSDAPTGIEADESEMESLTAAGSSFNVTKNVTYYARYVTCWTGSGSGTQSDPYQITSDTDWNNLATKVNSGHVTYKGKYFKLTDNISVTTQVGQYESTSKCFAGILYGDGHTLTYTASSGSTNGMAPFGSVNGATICDLHVTGTISATDTNAKYAAGLIGYVRGTTTVTNCRVSVTINSSYSSFGYHGGFVGANLGSLDIEGSIFDGTFSGSNTNRWGGFVGYNPVTNSKTKITDCLFIPASVSINTNDSKTFARSNNNITISNSYYTKTCGGTQGTQAYTVESGTEGLTLDYGSGTNYGNISVYSSGLLYSKKLYTGGTTEVTFTPLVSDDTKGAYGVKANDNALTANVDGSYSLTMNSADVIVTANILNLHYDDLTLNDVPASVTNASTIETNNGQTVNVTISGRKLYKDGSWNTLCLPFDVSAAQIAAYTDLSGCTIKELDTDGWYDGNTRYDEYAEGRLQTGFDAFDGTLYLYFKTATEIEARKPYIIKWTAATPNYFESPVFNVSTIESSNPKPIESADGKVRFIGLFDPVDISGNGYLYLGAGDQLYWPSTTRTINAFRAYFQLHGIEAGEVAHARMFFGDDGETTGIISTTNFTNYTNSDNAWYDLQGRKLSKKPTAKGIYIYKGTKRVIK